MTNATSAAINTVTSNVAYLLIRRQNRPDEMRKIGVSLPQPVNVRFEVAFGTTSDRVWPDLNRSRHDGKALSPVDPDAVYDQSCLGSMFHEDTLGRDLRNNKALLARTAELACLTPWQSGSADSGTSTERTTNNAVSPSQSQRSPHARVTVIRRDQSVGSAACSRTYAMRPLC